MAKLTTRALEVAKRRRMLDRAARRYAKWAFIPARLCPVGKYEKAESDLHKSAEKYAWALHCVEKK